MSSPALAYPEFCKSVHDMWNDDAPLVLGQIKQHYLVEYAALPSNTHRAESNVKDANFCQVKGRAENLSSFDSPIWNRRNFE
jgi:hypothetical protein